MSVSLSRQSLSSSGIGMRISRSSSGPLLSQTPSVYGGAGGFGTRISQVTSINSPVFASAYADIPLVSNEKVTMQNLNDRLGTYLDRVRSLESSNRQLEVQIREYYEKRASLLTSRDFSSFFAIINDLRAQIGRRHLENQRIILQIDNAQLATEDFKMKYEMEANMRSVAEADVHRLRGVRDNLTMAISDVEITVGSLKDQLAQLKLAHKEEMQDLREQIKASTVNVDVEVAAPVDLARVLTEVRQEYEALVQKNKLELEKWYQNKVDSLQTEITSFSTEVKTFSTQAAELKRTYQSLEITRQSVIAEIQCLIQNLEETKSRYGTQLSLLQATINKLELELQQLRVSIEQQQTEYQMLLDLKMRLEMEIAEYRRLLDGDVKKAVVISKVVEETKPVVERRTKTIVEEIIDGKVVSSVVDTQVEEIQ